jgi:hypothetical protein
VILCSEFRNECVEHMSSVAHTCEQNERPPCTAPIENFKLTSGSIGVIWTV